MLVVCLALLVALIAGSANAANPARSAAQPRRVGIDTRFGDLLREAAKQHGEKKYAQAIALYTEALQMRPDPKNAGIVHLQRGDANMSAENHAAAVDDFDKARQLGRSETVVYNDAAWLRATSPDPAVRNGKLAVQQANRACQLSSWKDARHIDTLAAAHAEAGDFNRAAELQRQAIKLSSWSDRKGMQERLRLFEARMPYRLKKAAR